MTYVLKSPLHWLVSFQLMLLVVIGRKTGRQFEIPVSFAKLDGVYVALTLKANQWWRNLKEVLAPPSSAVSEWLAP